MALNQFQPGSPLRTLCLLIAGQPADVFSNPATQSTVPGSLNTFQQPAQVTYKFTVFCQGSHIIENNGSKQGVVRS